MRSIKKQQGVAIIFVVTMVAILVPILTKLAFDQRLLTKKVSLGTHYNNAYLYALAVETWGRQLLTEDQQKNQHDGLNEFWAQLLFPMPVDGGTVAGRIEDLQGRMNLNNLQAQNNQVFKGKLIELFTQQGVAASEADAVVSAIEDWVDVDDKVRLPYGAEDNEYMSLELPYRAANGAMRSISELRLIQGMTPEIWDKVSPFLTTLPIPDAKVNINTAPAEVLKAIFPSHAHSGIGLFLQVRDKFSFTSLADFEQDYETNVGQKIDTDVKKLIDVKSSFFVATIKTKFGEGGIDLYSVLERDNTGVKVHYRSFGDL